VTSYVDAVRAHALRVRHELRWFNAVTVEATPAQVAELAALPFVDHVAAVRKATGRPEPVSDVAAAALQTPAVTTAHVLDYGTGLGQVEQINVPAVHDLGLHGEGMVIALLDAGFDTLGHAALAPLRILAAQDFVNGDGDVSNNGDIGEGSHGTATLSTIGGFAPGQLIGPAFAASYLLAKTENTETETPREEDNWAAAAEWAEAQGVDVISSSLGYSVYDFPYASYTWLSMDGRTAISTRAAELAAERGVVVVVSAGNEGPAVVPGQNTLGAPADGISVITAAAVTSGGVRASFSSVGPSADGRIKPDVAAQGVAVKVARPFTTSSYGTANGTSFSCPLVAGVAALVLQAHPTYTPYQVASVLRNTASQAAAPDNATGWGIVNALAAIQAVPPVAAVTLQ
jgi:subtilisin family serine protease